MKKQLVFVLYDSIFNSVFESQVVAPIKKQLDEGEYDHVIIISFERTQPTAPIIKEKIDDPRITLIVAKKIPFLGSISMWYAQWQFKRILNHYTPATLVARGPLAGYIVGTSTTQSFTLLARGLAAEEYRYVHDHSILHRFRAWQYEQIERSAYQMPHARIQTVSKALRTYLIETFHTDPKQVIVSAHDIPPSIPALQKSAWRSALRKRFSLADDRTVYVYSGSAHPWQCAEESIDYFVAQYKKNRNIFLFVLTSDQKSFRHLLARADLPPSTFHITTVPHADIYRYLAAADVGLMLRKPHIVSWVSRPTKALEYKAAGLQIQHNNTVEMLSDL
jgi:hypothetical protein